MGQTLQQKERMKEKYRKKRNREELKEYLPRLAWGSAKRSGNRIGRCSTKEIHVKYMYSVLFCVPSGIAGIIICVSRGGRTQLLKGIIFSYRETQVVHVLAEVRHPRIHLYAWWFFCA